MAFHGRCTACGENRPTVHATMSHNIGMLVMRRSVHTEGELCSSCLWWTFAKHMGLNLLLGWWGTISFFLTLYYFVKNVAELASGLGTLGNATAKVGLERHALEKSRAQTDAPTALGPFRHTIRMRLGRGEDPDEIARDMVEVGHVTFPAARQFVDECAR